MKNNVFVLACVAVLIGLSTVSIAGDSCVTIKDGTLLYAPGHYLAGQPLKVGYDDYGYNYQAHQFMGSYANVYLGRDGFPPYTGDDEDYLAENPEAENHWAWPFRADQILMKWNDAWLSNKDCNVDGKLDRPDDNGGSYIGSGAWETNHGSGNTPLPWTEFIKIVAVPETAVLQDTGLNIYGDSGTWFTVDGLEIGPSIWGQFAVIQDQGKGIVPYRSPAGPGFGKFGKE